MSVQSSEIKTKRECYSCGYTDDSDARKRTWIINHGTPYFLCHHCYTHFLKGRHFRPDKHTRFMSKVEKTHSCWIWRGHTDNLGYGVFWVGSKLLKAHRFSYQHYVGSIPEGKELDHLCRNRACVNPTHLEPVSHKENCLRGTGGWNMKIKTHCPQGHPLEGKNLVKYYLKLGKRRCRTCQNEQLREWRKRQTSND